MSYTKYTCISSLAIASVALAQPHHHDEDFVVGVSSSGVLGIEGDFDEHFELPAFDNGTFVGWLGDEPGLTNLDEDEPGEDFYMLAAGADIQFELVGTDPAMKVYDPFFNLLSPGGSFALGGNAFDEHPFWHIDSDDAAFNPGQTEWNVQFKVVDTGTTGYSDSPIYTATFTNIPAPGTALVLGALGLRAGRRQRA